jgi:hypothetical protein
MAGQGWREWVAGEQLTDVKMQQFLQDQAVMRFPDSATRGSALAGVVSEGMVSYLDDSNALEVYDGSAWGAVTPDVQQASPTFAGVVFGRTSDVILGGVADSSYTVALGNGASAGTARPNASFIGNTTIGANTGRNVTTGHNNVVVGGEAGLGLTTGVRNVIVGTAAGQSNSTGEDNVLVGHGAGFGATSSSNTAIGKFTLQSATGGSNTAIGQTALQFVTSGLGNVGVGGGAGTSITTGSINTCLGPDAGSNFAGIAIGSGGNNTLIGFNAAVSTANVSNQITLGNSSITSLRCQVTTISALSDRRDKTNITPLSYGLDFVKELKPVSFDWNMRDGAKVGNPDIGFIAQDLADLEDKYDAERLNLTLRDNPEKLEATPGRLIPILVKAIQELTARVEELENAR